MAIDGRTLERLFAACFEAEYATVLVGGGDEPLYLPSATPATAPHRVVYRADYVASALHEVAHWCLAGAARRALEDYGYWYAPDGRDAAQQAEFERVEARPQALESIFADASGLPFHLSADNLDAGFGPSDGFAQAVEAARSALLAGGLPRRAERFRRALEAERLRSTAAAGPTTGAARPRPRPRS